MPAPAAPEPVVSVVVPTRNRPAKLRRCLEALDGARDEAPLEVIVVDDGSTEETAALLRDFPQVEAVHRSHAGRGAARNPGVDRARGWLVLFIDDDVVAAPGLVRRHVEHHRRHPEPEEALVGLVTWAPELDVSAHMRWLERGGPLFAFDEIDDPDDVDWRHFCTSNASVKREFLPSSRPFDDELRRCVDIELGYRLARAGMRLRYDARAQAQHLRIDTPTTTCIRMREVGEAMRCVHAKHPELAEPPPSFGRLTGLKAALARVAAPVLRSATVEERLFSYQAARAYAEGYANGRRLIAG